MTDFPSHVEDLRRAVPVYETLPGWQQPITAVERMDALARQRQTISRPHRRAVGPAGGDGFRRARPPANDFAPDHVHEPRRAHGPTICPTSPRERCRATWPSSWTATAAGPVSAGLPRIEGHRAGVTSVRRVTEESARLGIGQLTLYCLSSENWKRPAEELDFLMRLLQQYLVEERPRIMEHNIRVKWIGRREGLPEVALRELDETVAIAAANTGLRVCLAHQLRRPGGTGRRRPRDRRATSAPASSTRAPSTRRRSPPASTPPACPSPTC